MKGLEALSCKSEGFLVKGDGREFSIEYGFRLVNESVRLEGFFSFVVGDRCFTVVSVDNLQHPTEI